MYGGGSFKLVAIKEIKTTESFHYLREDQKNCQTAQTFEDCVSQLLIYLGKTFCGCAPYELMDFADTNHADEVFKQQKKNELVISVNPCKFLII